MEPRLKATGLLPYLITMDFHENFVILFIFLKIVSLRIYWKMEKYRSVLQQYISFVLLEMFFTVYYHQCDQILIWNLLQNCPKIM